MLVVMWLILKWQYKVYSYLCMVLGYLVLIEGISSVEMKLIWVLFVNSIVVLVVSLSY